MPLNTLVGAWKASVGLCTTGQILAAGQWCSPLDPHLSSFGSDSTVGCLVRLDDDSAFETWDGVVVTAITTFNVNGRVVIPPVASGGAVSSGANLPMMTSDNSMSGSESIQGRQRKQNGSPRIHHASTLPLFVPRDEELFPTLTLHSSETQVMSRFCADDVLARSREEIGAPPGVTIYCVDGSVLLDATADDSYPSDLSSADFEQVEDDGEETDVSDSSLESLSDTDGDNLSI